jgi:hypothetical protein
MQSFSWFDWRLIDAEIREAFDMTTTRFWPAEWVVGGEPVRERHILGISCPRAWSGL